MILVSLVIVEFGKWCSSNLPYRAAAAATFHKIHPYYTGIQYSAGLLSYITVEYLLYSRSSRKPPTSTCIAWYVRGVGFFP